MRCERGFIIVVSPPGSPDVTDQEEDMRIVGMDIHRVAAEAVTLIDGK